jgi:hypothetical protein
MFGPRLYAVIPAASGCKYGKDTDGCQPKALCFVQSPLACRYPLSMATGVNNLLCTMQVSHGYIKQNAGTMLYMCRVAKHCLSCSVTGVVTESAQLSDLENCDSDFRRDESRRTRSTSYLMIVYQFKYNLHEFVTTGTTI